MIIDAERWINELEAQINEEGCPWEIQEINLMLINEIQARYDCVDEESENKGKLLKLPCAVGDTVYEIIKIRETISEFTVIGFSVSEHGIFVKWKLMNGIYRNLSGFNDDEIGKTVFLTKEEAEAALKNM